MEPFTDVHTATSRGPSTSGLPWTSGSGFTSPVLRMEDAVVETVVTHTTRTTTSFKPITLPRIPPPEHLSTPHHLSPETFPLSHEPTPDDMRFFTIMLGGKRVVVQDEGSSTFGIEGLGQVSGPGWTRTAMPHSPITTASSSYKRKGEVDERVDFLQALNRTKGKEVRKRPHHFTRPGTHTELSEMKVESATPPTTADGLAARQRSPPRKKIRGLEELSIPQDGNSSLLSPLPSPEHEHGPNTASSRTSSSPPTLGSGLELAALFSLPSLIGHFDALPERLQQNILMHLLRRSRMPTIQRVASFAGIALKRDFISLLPHEVSVQILRKMDRSSLAVASRVSKKWRRMIDSERVVWQQRLIDDDFWSGHGVAEAEERRILERYEILDYNRENQHVGSSKIIDTPSDDERMPTAVEQSKILELDRPTPLKHVYRRRYTNQKTWLHNRPEHTSFPGHGTNVVTCLQFDEDKIISASDDHSINIYNTSDGQLRKRLDGHEGGVWTLQYKGDTLVSGSTDRTVRVWDLEELKEVHVFHGHTSTVRCLEIVEPVWDESTGEFQPPYPMIVTGSRDATLRVWKLPKKGEPAYRKTFETGHDPSQIAPDENPFHLHLLEGHSLAVRALATHGRLCVSGSYDMSVRVWDIVKGTCIHVLTGHESKVYSIVYDKYRNRCASGSMDNTVKVWNVGTGECLHTLTGHTSLVGLLGLSPNYLISAAADASLRIWDAESNQLKNVLASHGGAITCFQHDETKVVSGSDGALKLWDIRTGVYIRDLVVGISSVWQVAFKGSLLVAASNRGGSTAFDVFNFGSTAHPSGIDDDGLDAMRPPPWERGDRREPQGYQVKEEWDDLTSMNSPPVLPLSLMGNATTPTQPRSHNNTYRPGSSSAGGHGTLGSLTSRQHLIGNGGGSRRSSRIADKTAGQGLREPSAQASSSSGRRGRGRSDEGNFAFNNESSYGTSTRSHRRGSRHRQSTSLSVESPTPTPTTTAGGSGQSFAPIFDLEDDEEEEIEEEDADMEV